jgi:hypothetical protein
MYTFKIMFETSVIQTQDASEMYISLFNLTRLCHVYLLIKCCKYFVLYLLYIPDKLFAYVLYFLLIFNEQRVPKFTFA